MEMQGRVPDLADKVFLVSGASTGIGAAVARALGAQGARVAVHYNSSADAAKRALADIESAGGNGVVIPSDLSIRGAAEVLVGTTVDHFGWLDGLVSNAGSIVDRTPFAASTDTLYDDLVNLNVLPVVEASPCSATAMRKASRRLTQLYDNALTPCGIRSTQFAILAELDRRSKEPPTMNELADGLVIDRSALGHNLRPLERDGLIALEESEEDRRRRHVILTRHGKAKVAEARRLWQTAQDRFNNVFGRSKATALRATLLSIARDERLATLRD